MGISIHSNPSSFAVLSARFEMLKATRVEIRDNDGIWHGYQIGENIFRCALVEPSEVLRTELDEMQQLSNEKESKRIQTQIKLESAMNGDAVLTDIEIAKLIASKL